jgi:PEGA domain
MIKPAYRLSCVPRLKMAGSTFGRCAYVAVFFFVVQFAKQADAQDYIARSLWEPFITVGYENANVGDLGVFYNNVLDYYRGENVPISSQSNFGPTLHLGAGFLFSPMKPIWLGLAGSYYDSPAYANYRDYSGTLKVTGQLNCYQLDIIARGNLRSYLGLPLFASLRPGIALMYPNVTQDLVFTDSPKQTYLIQMKSPSWTITVEATVGASFPAGPFTMSIEGGYRFASSGEIEYSTLIPVPGGPPAGDRMASWSVVQTGPVVDISLGFGFGKDSEPEATVGHLQPLSGNGGPAGIPPRQPAGEDNSRKTGFDEQAALSQGNLVVSASPADVEVTVVKKGVTTVYKDYTETIPINPDTLGTWKAPLSTMLGLGDYDVIAEKSGYGKLIKSVSIDRGGKMDVSLSLVRLDRLAAARTWNTIKWISAGVAVTGGIGALVSGGEVTAYSLPYRNDATVSSAREDHGRISSAQKWLRITSAAAFSAAGTFVVSWIMEAINR